MFLHVLFTSTCPVILSWALAIPAAMPHFSSSAAGASLAEVHMQDQQWLHLLNQQDFLA